MVPEQLYQITSPTTQQLTTALLDRPVRPYLPDNPQTMDTPEQGQPRAENIYDAMLAQWRALDTKLHIRPSPRN